MTFPLRWAEAALNCWMNWPGFTPCWPRAGPIGGAGVAVPPGAWSLNWTVISFLAMTYSLGVHAVSTAISCSLGGAPPGRLKHRGLNPFAAGGAGQGRREVGGEAAV